MAATYLPFNSMIIEGMPDRPVNAKSLAAYLAGFFSNGVVMQEDTALQIETSNGMNIQIRAGMGVIKGKSIINDTAYIMVMENAHSSLDRIDRVVFRLDEANRLMEFDVLTGTPAASPTAPALSQDTNIYELCLAEIIVPAGATSITASNITDTRADVNLCGISRIPPHIQDTAHGGTGIIAKTKEKLLLALGGTNVKKLWENDNPFFAFDAQLIELDLSSYALIYIVVRTSTESEFTKGVLVSKGDGAVINTFHNIIGDYPVRFTQRTFQTSDAGVQVSSDYTKHGEQTAPSSPSKYIIPYRIYGVISTLGIDEPTPDITATDDGSGNVTVYGITATDDGSGNVMVYGATAMDDESGNVTLI